MIERRIAVVFVVDPHGRVLMQHRSRSAAVSPNQWTMPGGKIEEGEQPIEAARREVLEETGLTVTDLVPVWSGTRPSVKSTNGVVEVHAFAAVTSARQDEVVLGEGQAMVFMLPDEARRTDLGVTARLVLAPFLESETYRQLCERARQLRRPDANGTNGANGANGAGGIRGLGSPTGGGTGTDGTGTH